MNEVFSKCENSPDDFCYVCGEYSSVDVKKRISKAHERAYLSYFGFRICDQNKQWVPHFICRKCHLGLLKWMNDCGEGLSFSKPTLWNEPTNHNTDCYFCATQIDIDTGTVEYANVISVIKPIRNSTTKTTATTTTAYPHHLNSTLPAVPKCDEPHLILPNDLDLLISGLDLSERSAEILVKAFQEWKILAPC